MSFEIKRRLYESSPAWLKTTVRAIPFALLAGSTYRRHRANGRRFDRASREEIDAFTDQQLGRVLSYAVEHVPAYKRYASVVARLPPREALRAFPIIDKAAVQANIEQFLSGEFNQLAHYSTTTGGTSGEQLTIHLEDNSQSLELAFMHRQWARVGYSPNRPKATFRGVAFFRDNRDQLWQANPIYNEMQFSVFHMTEDRLESYVEQLGRYQPHFLHGYPSAIDTLAEYVLRRRSPGLNSLQAVLLGSEGATPAQRARIAEAFRARVYTWYGHSERLILGGECEHSTNYHHFPDYGFAEIIDEHGDPVRKDGDRGELVGTAFWNRCMPLIRYRTDDWATLRLEPCRCGRAWTQFSDVQGRWGQEALLSKQHGRISLTALNMHGPIFDNVARFQYVQRTVGHCTIRVVPTPAFTQTDADEIVRSHHEKVRGEIEFDIETTTELALTQRGKLKRLVQSVPRTIA